MAKQFYYSDPAGDRRAAAQAKHGPRRPVSLDNLVSTFKKSQQWRRAKRFHKVVTALHVILTEQQLSQVKPIYLAQNSLTLEVENGALLTELKQFRQRDLLDALVQAGTGVTRIVFRLAKSK